jgi:putative membrane protein insertion efficiency factor
MPEAATATSAQMYEDLARALERVTSLAPELSADNPSASVPSVDEEVPAPDPTDATRSGARRVLYWIGWPLRSLLLGLIWVYRHTISPILPPTCRYHPSCSAYGFEALQVHGAAKGTALTVWRVLRCNPFTPGGLDPVPRRGAWRPDIHPDGTPRVTAHPVA